ncbi:nitrite reductase small subunit NirD [Leptospira sp. 96542]|nr:nitrite reductase small subunit NirD [Leptospira sp. 96542]
MVNDKIKFLVGSISDFELEGGSCVKIGNKQIAIFYFQSRNEWYACDNACPHTGDMVLSRGILGDLGGEPKVVCPLHKRNFSLSTGDCLSGENYKVTTYPVVIEGDNVYLEVEDSMTKIYDKKT